MRAGSWKPRWTVSPSTLPPGTVVAPGALHTLHERTAGNPFFLRELLRMLADRGALGADEPAARHGLDAGASTGGFTDCLLRRGAAHVVAVDVGYGQLAWSLRTDERVTVLERTNVRDLRPENLPYRPEIVVADLSFISLRTVVPVLARVASVGADLVLLVKPQFEVGRERVGSGGVVRDPDAWRDAVRGVADACVQEGLTVGAVMASPLPGPAGNLEFPLHARLGPVVTTLELEAAIEEARGIRGVGEGVRS